MTHAPLILIVEDEPDWAHLLQMRLERQGYRTVVAGDGRRALDLAFTHKPDLVILDLMLPELHGLTVCRILNQSRAFHQTPVVVLTALSGPEKREAGLRCGAARFLTKPVAVADVLANVQELLEERAAAWAKPSF